MAKRRRPASFGPLTEEDLELRLGPRTDSRDPITFKGRSINGIEEEEEGISHDSKSNGLKRCAWRNRKHGVVEEGEVRFTCGICLDTMTEESSTKCGHLFCRSCITDAIRIQGNCPTCRTRMSVRSIRRIFFPKLSSS